MQVLHTEKKMLRLAKEQTSQQLLGLRQQVAMIEVECLGRAQYTITSISLISPYLMSHQRYDVTNLL